MGGGSKGVGAGSKGEGAGIPPPPVEGTPWVSGHFVPMRSRPIPFGTQGHRLSYHFVPKSYHFVLKVIPFRTHILLYCFNVNLNC